MKPLVVLSFSLCALLLTACAEKKDPQAMPDASRGAQPGAEYAPPRDSSPPANDPYTEAFLKPSAGDAKPGMGADTEGGVDNGPLAPSRGAKPSTEKRSGASSKKPAAASGRTHVVQKGDTLSGIAKKYYGDANRWREIWDANKTRVPDKNKLKVGTKLIIP